MPSRRRLFRNLALSSALFTCAASAFPQSADTTSGWRLTWSDEFDKAGSSVDSTKWTAETGGNGWGNHELQSYTAKIENLRQENGNLVITARREEYTGSDGIERGFTSGRLNTLGKFAQKYGRIESRIRIPQGRGLWPAFWMLGADFPVVKWPACGEIDIMENIGSEPSTVHGSIHGPGYIGAPIEAHFVLPGKRRFAAGFHVFAIEWEPDTIRFYVDNHLYVTRRRSQLKRHQKWVFDHPFFLVLNLAVGGDWPGSPDSATVFPQSMLVDYVRVYERDPHAAR